MWDLGESGSGVFNITTTTGLEPAVDSINLSCAARNIQGPVELPYSSTLTITLRAVSSIYYIILVLVGGFLNSLVILLVARYKQLQTYAFGIALQVIVLNLLLVSLTVMALVNVIANRWVFGEVMCAVVGLLLFVFTSVRTLLMFVFVIDRFLSVFCPFFYPKNRVKIVVSLSVASWMFAVVSQSLSLPPIFDCFMFSANMYVCGASATCNHVCLKYYGLAYALIYTPASLVPVILYVILYIKAKIIMKKLQNSDTYSRREWKLTATFFLLFITVLGFYIPGGAIALLSSIRYQSNERPAFLHVLSTLGGHLNAAIVITDPIVIMRHEEVRKIKQKLFREVKVKLSTTFSLSVSDNK